MPPPAVTAVAASTATGPTATATTNRPPSPTKVVLPAHKITTVDVGTDIPSGTSTIPGVFEDVIILAQASGTVQDGAGTRLESITPVVLLDYVATDLKGLRPIEPVRRQPLPRDRWNVYMPGRDASGSGSPITSDTPQELRLVFTFKNLSGDVMTGTEGTGLRWTIDVNILEPSRYFGIASNDSGGAMGELEDLSFSSDSNQRNRRGLVVPPSGKPFVELPLFVKDYAAMGKIQATFRVEEMDFEAVRNLPRSLPLNEDNDHLADEWERKVLKAAGYNPLDTSRLGDLDDNDTNRVFEVYQTGQTMRGDGYTAFEEYRGFFVTRGGKPVHRRTDELQDETPGVPQGANPGGPFRKDLFLEDQSRVFAKYGQRMAGYGFSVHLVGPNDSYRGDEIETGLMNKSSPDDFRIVYPPVRSRPDLGQFRLLIQEKPNLGDYGVAQGDGFRGAESVLVDTVRLKEFLTSPCGTTRLDRERSFHWLRQLVVHEVGHRLKLTEPERNVTISKILDRPDQPLPAEVEAAFVPSGNAVRIRLHAERRKYPPDCSNEPTRYRYWLAEVPKKFFVGPSHEFSFKLETPDPNPGPEPSSADVEVERSVDNGEPERPEEYVRVTFTLPFPDPWAFSREQMDEIIGKGTTVLVKHTSIGSGGTYKLAYDSFMMGATTLYFPATGRLPGLSAQELSRPDLNSTSIDPSRLTTN